jgi:hypothetical protein
MLLPLIIAGAVAQIIRLWAIGVDMDPFGRWHADLFPTLFSQLFAAIIQVALFFVSVELVQRLAQFFSGGATRERAMSLVAHAMLPSLAAGILWVVPLPGFLMLTLALILAVVGLYAFYQGVSVMTSVTEQNRLGFTASLIGITLLVGLVLNWVVGSSPRPPLS